MATEDTFQIGEVAETVGLSIRTIRHYDELNIVGPSGRTTGGFRLYTDTDVAKLRLAKHLKPLQFSLEEIQEIIALLDADEQGHPGELTRAEQLGTYAERAEQQYQVLRTQLAAAEEVIATLRTSATNRVPVTE